MNIFYDFKACFTIGKSNKIVFAYFINFITVLFILQATWLCKSLPEGSRVGADPFLLSHSRWKPLAEQLEASGHFLVPIEKNLINIIWSNRPARPAAKVMHLCGKFTGKTTSEKLSDMRSAMKENGATVLVITALDELAWLLNMRGCDIAFNPVFFAYGIVTMKGFMLFMDNMNRMESAGMDYLKQECGDLVLYPYGDVGKKLDEIVREGSEGK